jgi:nucleoside phosphorylase
MIAVTFALPEESKDLRRELRETRQIGLGKAGPVLTGDVRGLPLVLCHTGVGTEAAVRETRSMLEKCRPSLVVSSGFAGALSDRLRVGDVVFDPRDTGHAGLDRLMPHCFVGKIHTHRQTIETPEEKAALGRESCAIAVDMETAQIAAVCAEAGIPIVGIRGISDAATDPLPVPMAHWFDMDRQRARPLALVLYLMRNPGRIAPFARFVRGLSGARRAMTRGILLFLEEIVAAGK